MAGFFSPDNWYWKPFSHVGDAVILSGLWTLCSIPLFTLGGATAALYDTVAHCVRGGETDLFSRFFSTFRREWKSGFCAAAPWLLLLFFAYRAVRSVILRLSPGSGAVMLAAGLIFLLILAVGLFSWVLPLLSRFTFSPIPLQVTALRLACAHPFRTVASGVCTAVCFSLCLRTVFGLSHRHSRREPAHH